MAFANLREFVAHLEKHGQLRRVTRARLARPRDHRDHRPRLQGRRRAATWPCSSRTSQGFAMPGAHQRLRLARAHGRGAGVERLDDLAARVAKLLDLRMPGSLFDKLRKLGDLFDVAKAGPKRVRSAPCQEVVETDRPSLAAPARRSAAGRATPAATSRCPWCSRAIPSRGARNVGMYRLQVYDDRTLGMHWQIHKGSAEHQRAGRGARRSAHGGGHRARAAIPSRSTRAPRRCRRASTRWSSRAGCAARACRMVPCKTVRRRGARRGRDRARGLRGSGRAAARRARSATTPATTRWPATIRSSTSRRSRGGSSPIYPTTIVGRPPQEDYWLGKATERIFLPIIRMMLPEVVDMNMPAEGVFHNLVIVSIRKRYPGHARKVMYALWGLGLMMLAKTIVVVSEHVNVHDLSEVAWRATGNIDPQRDLVLVDGPMDDLDHAALRHRFGGKLGIDATEKTEMDGIGQPWPDEIVDERGGPARSSRGAGRSTGSSRRVSARPPLPRRDQVRAHRLRPALRLRGDGAGRGRLAGLARAGLGDPRHGGRAHARHEREPPRRPLDRRRATPARARRHLPAGLLTPRRTSPRPPSRPARSCWSRRGC